MDLLWRIENATDCKTIKLEKDKTYHVWQGDCPLRFGHYFSNTATKEENPDGRHRAAFYLQNKKNIKIDGNGATLLIHGVVTPMLFDGCENVTVKNLTIDYARPTMSEFTIEKKEGKGYLLHIPEEYLFEIRGNTLVWLGEKDLGGNRLWEIPYKDKDVLSMYYHPEEEKICILKTEDGDVHPSVPKFSRIERIDGTHVRVELENETAFFPVGCTVQTRRVTRMEAGAGFLYCKNLRLENVRICAMNGFGLLAQFCENVTYNGLDCTPKIGRTAASNADFFHFSGCKGDIVIENCKAAAGHDDFINVHGTHLRIIEHDKEKNSLLVRFMNAQSRGFKAFFVGDKLELIKWNTLLPYAEAEVREVRKINDTDVLLVLDRALPEIELGKDVVENATWTPSLTVRNNYFGCSGCRGILCTTRKPVLIENNVFYHVSGVPLLVEDDCNFWFESGYTQEIVFKNNRVVGCGYGFENEGGPLVQITPKILDENFNGCVHGSLILEKNTFEEANIAGHFFCLEYVDKVVLSKNSFDAEYTIVKKAVRECREEENTVRYEVLEKGVK